ncbi:MAG: sigma-70 family RNA polymerase sigma factor [Candidatus Riflebacteria bacterium]|nr:sigma-70 family RNA polymerase sigma factor [Candidatus Riflebacteria bacterium]
MTAGETTLDEANLIRQCVEGQPDACRELFETYCPMVRGVARRMLRDDHGADDVAQEVFERVFLNLHRFRKDASLATWIRRIAVNRCLNVLERPGRTVSLEGLDDALAGTQAQPQDREGASDLERGLARLAPAERALVVMAAQQDTSYEDLGRVFRATRDEIRGRLYRARCRLKEFLKW